MRTICWLSALGLATPLFAQHTELRPGKPARLGFDATRLQAAADTYAAAVADDQVRGAVLMVVRGRHIVLHEALGHRDLAGERKMARDSLFRMASNTKAITAAAVLALVDDGKLRVEAPIHRWFPGFDHGISSEITLRHLLTHTSGLRIDTLFLQPLMEPSEEHPDAPDLVLEVGRFGAVGAAVKPGTTYAYNNPGFNTLAGLVEVVAEQPFAEFVQQRFYEPLGMTDTCHHESMADHGRMSAIFRHTDEGWEVGWQPGDAPDYPFVRGSGGMISTAKDYATFCQMVLDDGEWNGVRILSRKVLRAATRSQTQLEAHGYGFGWQVTGPGRFEHGGSDGTWAWCDRERDLIGIVFTQTQGKIVDTLREQFRADVHAALRSGPPAPDVRR